MTSETEKLAELLFPDVIETPEAYEKTYPPRTLPEGAKVTRFAPSPTGRLHIGGLFGALTDYMTAKASGGVFFLRIEDTDKKREFAGGLAAVLDGLTAFGVSFDEGAVGPDSEKGAYGPYIQSRRAAIYRAVAKDLVRKGLAYPCFCSQEELAALRKRQEKDGAAIRGYFGKYARCRALTYEQIEKRIRAGGPYVLRFRSGGDENRRISFEDLIRGRLEMPENIIDEVLLKSDGLPTYHFAHVCDDHFMRVTHVIRAEEWLSSVPKHIALFKACGFRVPKYAHTPQVMKLDEETGAKRKLSKRKDPEASVSYFAESGYPKEALLEYLLTLLNSNFEDWRRANPQAELFSFPFSLKRMSVSGCLFDLAKLSNVSKTVISRMTADEVYRRALEWAQLYDTDFYAVLKKDGARLREMLGLDRGGKKPRKDLAKWSGVKEYFSYFYPQYYKEDFTLPENISNMDAAAILRSYSAVYSPEDDKDAWFQKIKDLCAPLGFAPSVREYRENPNAFKGNVGDFSTVIRVAATSRSSTPDLWTILRLLGEDEVQKRFHRAIKFYEEAKQ